MNLLFITLDGARIDRVLESPIIEELRQKGTIFPNVVTYAPYTIAAMHAIFSGEYGFNNGVNSYWATYKFKSDQYKTLTQYLQEKRFHTVGDAINELVLPRQGFEELKYHNEDKDNLTERHKNLLSKMKELQSSGNRFFLYLHYSNIHTNIKHDVLKKYNNFSKEYFDNRIQNEKKYDEYFKDAESYLSKIMDYCKKIDLLSDTLVVIVSDHGISTGEKFGERAYGAYCYDYTVVTFALFIKDGLFLPKTVTQQIRSIDIMPTILDVLKIPQDPMFKKISGRSIIPLIHGNEESRAAIIETGNPLQSDRPPKEPNVVAIRKNNWKLILNLHNNTKELYDLTTDPHEQKNLNGKEEKIENNLLEELVNTNTRLKENEMVIGEKLQDLGYWKKMYGKPHVFGEGPTKLAIIAHNVIKNTSTKKILELGCGQGRDAIFFSQKGYLVTATDFSPEAIKFVKDKAMELNLPYLSVSTQDLRRDFHFKEEYDCVYSNLAFQFLNEHELEEVFDRVASVLIPSGLFIFSTKKPGDKYYKAGEKVDERAYKINGVVRYFFDKKMISDLLKRQFEVSIIEEENHTNLDGTVSAWWYVIAHKL